MTENTTTNRLEFQRRVNMLTNYQRNRWAKAGYPGLHNNDPDYHNPDVLKTFLCLEHQL